MFDLFLQTGPQNRLVERLGVNRLRQNWQWIRFFLGLFALYLRRLATASGVLSFQYLTPL